MTTSLLVEPPPGAVTAGPRLRWVRYEPEPGPHIRRRPPPPLPDWPGTAPGVDPTGFGSATAGAAVPGGPALVPAAGGLRSTRPAGSRRHSFPAEASRAEHIEAQHAVGRQLRTALEVLDGRRPVAHIADRMTPPALRYWRAATEQRRVSGPARFRRMRLCLPRSGVAEVALTCEIDGRPRAVAARFERVRGRWLCTTVRLG